MDAHRQQPTCDTELPAGDEQACEQHQRDAKKMDEWNGNQRGSQEDRDTKDDCRPTEAIHRGERLQRARHLLGGAVGGLQPNLNLFGRHFG